MNICIIPDTSQGSIGIRNYSHSLLENFLAYKDSLKVSVLYSSKDLETDLLKKYPSYYIGLLNFPWNIELRQLFQIPHILSKMEVDLVHDTYQFGPFFTKGGTYKKVVTFYDLSPYIFRRTESSFYKQRIFSHYEIWARYRLFLKRILDNTDGIITISQYSKNDLITHLHIESEKISVIYPGINHNVFKIYPDEISEQVTNIVPHEEGKIIMCFDSDKTTEFVKNIILCIPHLIKKYSPITLLLAGTPNPEHQTLVKNLGLQKCIYFLGYVPNHVLPFIYNRADIFVYLSANEGFGFPPIEAMACGVPVIVNNSSSLPEIVGNNAAIIPSTDPEFLADALYDLIIDDGRLEDLRKKGLTHSQEFKWENTARQTLEFYEVVIKN